MTPTIPTPSTPPAAAPPAGASADAVALVRYHESVLVELGRIPYDLDYVTPEEILKLVRRCYEYQVDFTQGLEPTGQRGETVTHYSIPTLNTDDLDKEAVLTFESKACRVRREIFLETPNGTWIPDGNIVWAHQILGLLGFRVRQEQEVLLGRRRGE